MNNYNIVINGDCSQGSGMHNSILFTPAETVNNRRIPQRNANIKALNWEELFLHFKNITTINKPDLYTEHIRSDPTLCKEYKKNISRKVEHYYKVGVNNIQTNMMEQGVKQKVERYADGSADDLLQPMTNVINIGALHNTWIMINPKEPTGMAKIATTMEKRDDYVKLGYRIIEHEVDSMSTIDRHTIAATPTNAGRIQPTVRLRRETWMYVTRNDLAVLIEQGTPSHLPALEWDCNKNSKNTPGSLFSKDNYYLMLQHYCSLHIEPVKSLSVSLPWKDCGRKAAVKAKPKDLTYLEWAKQLNTTEPLAGTLI